MENLISVLKRFSFTESEAKVYIALLQSGAVTGYEASKLSGVPRSKVYNVLENLTSRGVVVTTAGEKGSLYKAEPVERLQRLIKSSVEDDLQVLGEEGKKFKAPFDDEKIWRLTGYKNVLEKCCEMIKACQDELMIQIWEDELTEEIEELLLKKEKSSKVLVILYDKSERYQTKLTQVYRHGFEDDRLRDIGSRWITIASDKKEMLHASIKGPVSAEAVYSKNASMVFFSREYILHDAYCLRLIKGLRPKVKEKFGEDMEGVRDVFSINYVEE